MPDKLSSLRVPDMPNDDQGAYYWLLNFAHALERDHAAVGVPGELSDTISQRVKAFDEAYQLTWMPDRRTSVAIAAKTQARNQAVLAVREALKIINGNSDISESQRLMLGLKRRLDRRMRPINRRSPQARRAAEALHARALIGVEPKPLLVAAALRAAAPQYAQPASSCKPEVPSDNP